MSDKKEVAVAVRNVHKEFILPQNRNTTFKQTVVNIVKKNRKVTQKVLNGVSFEVNKGDFFGIVGRNGSGKSTLLKIMAGVYTPTAGEVQINGNLTPFIELGVGFNPELSGRDNVFLNGALLGFNRKQMSAMYDDIVAFAELEPYMDQKLKNYSSGMQVRLAFSIAIKVQGDILVLDEVLAVGDEAFQRKCHSYFMSLKNEKKTVILVTHSMDAVRNYCNKACLIRDGKVQTIGLPNVVADEYSLENINNGNKEIKKTKESKGYNNSPTISAKILSPLILENTDKLKVEVTYKNIDNRTVYPKVVLYYEGVAVLGANGKILHNITTNDSNEHIVEYEIPLDGFNQGEVNVMAVLADSEKEVSLAHFGYENEITFIVRNKKVGTKVGGIIRDVGRMKLVR